MDNYNDCYIKNNNHNDNSYNNDNVNIYNSNNNNSHYEPGEKKSKDTDSN